MAKSRYSIPSQPSRGYAQKGGYGTKDAEGETFKDRNLAGMKPDAAQNAFQPTDADPVPLHKTMAGC